MDDRAEIIADFETAVNMSAKQIEKWLDTRESKEVGWTNEGAHESIGHQSGRRIGKLLAKPNADLTSGDLSHMKKVVGYIHRHRAQRPDGNIENTPWRYSLMNWGHDPEKKAKSTKKERAR